ncbi:hypothetical protein AGMMS50267_14190 [Spirochaetia bacterium]|nr:hypothetical protein AGMMS50267_14190 [Spirochaetia bacterium]
MVEYKSPEDSLSVADFHQVMAYAHLYCTPPESGKINDLTVTFICTREPREVKAHLRDVYHYTLTEKWPGITIIEGDGRSVDPMPMQIIERKKLPATEDLWLANLDRDVSFESVRAVLDEALKIPKEAPMRAYMYMLVKANEQRVKEVLKMSDAAIFDDIFKETGAAARWEAKGEAMGKAKGKVESAFEVARIMKADNEPVSKILRYTGLTEQQIAVL